MLALQCPKLVETKNTVLVLIETPESREGSLVGPRVNIASSPTRQQGDCKIALHLGLRYVPCFPKDIDCM